MSVETFSTEIATRDPDDVRLHSDSLDALWKGRRRRRPDPGHPHPFARLTVSPRYRDARTGTVTETRTGRWSEALVLSTEADRVVTSDEVRT